MISILALKISGYAESAGPRFQAKYARPISFAEKAGSGNETTFFMLCDDMKCVLKYHKLFF